MNIFPWQKKKQFFEEEEQEELVNAIKDAEMQTSGEIRIFIESKCRFVDPVDRAKEIFYQLEMQKTVARNATLIYVAVKHKQAAIFGDAGIHEKVGEKYWQDVVAKMLLHFSQGRLSHGICQGIADLRDALKFYYPYNKDTDKNELPDEIVFGR